MRSVQRQVQALVDSNNAYSMKVTQDWQTFRWSRITLLDDPAARFIRMKIHVISTRNGSYSCQCAEVSMRTQKGYEERCFRKRSGRVFGDVQAGTLVIFTLITHSGRNVSQCRGDSMLKLTANRETLIHRAAEQAIFARLVDILV